MIKSMTGFGRYEFVGAERKIKIIIIIEILDKIIIKITNFTKKWRKEDD